MDWCLADRISAINVLASGKTYYAALFNGDPFNGGTELALTRQAFTFTVATNVATISQAAKITFPATTVALADATHIGIFNALTGGSVRAAHQLDAVVPMPVNKVCSINTGVISTTMN